MSITGNLETLELSELLQWLAQGQKTGTLFVDNGEIEKRVYFDQGKIIFTESNDPQQHLGHLLIREGLIDQSILDRALRLREATQILLGKVLVTLGSVAEVELQRVLQRKTEETIYGLFSWTGGEFRFVPDNIPDLPMVPVALDVTNLVLEGAKRLDEERRAESWAAERLAISADEEPAEEPSEAAQEATGVGVDEPAQGGAPAGEYEPIAASPEPISGTDLPTLEGEWASDVRGSYGPQTEESKKQWSNAKLIGGLAAALAVVAIALIAYFFWPAQASTAQQESATSATPVVRLIPVAAAGPDEAGFVPIGDPLVGEVTAIPIPDAPSDEVPETESAPPSSEQRVPPSRAEEDTPRPSEREEARPAAARPESQASPQSVATESAEVAKNPAPRTSSIALQNVVAQVGNLSPPAGTQPRPEAESIPAPVPENLGDSEPPTQEVAATEARAAALEPATPEPALAEPATPEPGVQRGELVEPGPGVSPPRLLEHPAPRYPSAARRLGREAVVTVRVLVDENGQVAQVEQSGPRAGLGFDRAAVEAAQESRWQAATKDDRAVKMWVDLRLEFRPED